MKFNNDAFIYEFANFVKALDVKSALEIGCQSGELTDALKDIGITVAGYDIAPQREDVTQADIRTLNHAGKKKYDLVFSSGLLEHFPEDEIPNIIKKMASLSKKYVLNYVPNKNCIAYMKAKAVTTAEWKDELNLDESILKEFHEKAGLKVEASGLAAAEWAKRFGPEPSEPYLAFVLAKKSE